MADPDPYFLRTARLGFRPWTAADGGLAHGLWGDPAVTAFIDARENLSRRDTDRKLREEIASARAHGVQYWPIFALASGEHVGCCGLRPYDPAGGIYEIGAHVRSRLWRRGYASEALRGAAGYGFDVLGARGLFAGHNPANRASRWLLLKLGFRYTHDEHYPPTGLDHPSYRMTAEAFRSRGVGNRSGDGAP